MGRDSLTKLPERSLDVLRASAVLMVLLDHTMDVHGWSLPFVTNWTIGRLGVLIFFVHTSLVLMSSIERGGLQRGWVGRFYVRRAFRIYPLAIATILFAVPFSIGPHAFPVGSPDLMPKLSAKVWIGNLTLTQNLLGVDPMQGVLWSLPLEVQMYILLPICYLVARKSVRGVLGLIALAILSSYVVRHVDALWRLSLAYFAPVFLLGVLAYACLHRWPQTWDLPRSRFARAAKTIATYSYGIYLLHVPALWFAFTVLHAPSVVQWASFAVLLFFMPWLGYRLIERPLIRAGAALVHRAPAYSSEPAAP